MNVTFNTEIDFFSYACWLMATYSAVTIAMAADFVAGLRRARREGIVTTSRGFRMSIDKAGKYFLPMVCMTCIDAICTVVLPCPVFTMIIGVINILIEVKSVFENTMDKDEYRKAERILKVVAKNGKNLAKTAEELIDMDSKEMEDNNEENN